MEIAVDILAARKKRRVKKKARKHPKVRTPSHKAPKPKPKAPVKPKPTAPATPSPAAGSTPSASPTPSSSPQPSITSSPQPSATSSPRPSSTTSPTPEPSVPAPNSTPGDAWRTALPVATSRERLFLNRFGNGYAPATLAQLRALGTPEQWLEAQLRPGSLTESPKIAEIDSWFAPLQQTPRQRFDSDAAKTKRAYEYNRDLGSWTILRRIYSQRALVETMTDFWSNTLHIPVGTDYAWVYRFDYDQTIRQNALGTYEDLLIACSLHPAMRTYLGNWKSVRNNPNENQGRELLELHTVGVAAQYSESMVKDSAKILSGYTVDWGNTFNAVYNPAAHTTGPVQVLGFSSQNSAADGQSVTLDYLRYLARHPATARHVATKLATYFVSDTPSSGLIDQLASVYSSSGTSIVAMLRTLAAHPEFLSSEGQKVRTPVADMVAASRVLGLTVTAPTETMSFASWANYLHGGDLLYSWPRPDGAPLTGDAWSSVSRIFASSYMHQNFTWGTWPKTGVTFKQPAAWMPTSSLRFDAYVDHLSRALIGRTASARVQQGASLAVGIPAATLINSNHALAKSTLFSRLLLALLDSPDHMTI